MPSNYYTPCPELERCNELIERYWSSGQYEECFAGHMELARQGYPLAECQVGYFYWEGLGVEKDMAQALYWTRRAAEQGDRDAQCNLAYFYENGLGVPPDEAQARRWYKLAAAQGKPFAMERCAALGIPVD